MAFAIPTDIYNRNIEYTCPRCGSSEHRVAITNKYVDAQRRYVDLIRVDCIWCSTQITYVLPLNYVAPPESP